MKAGAAPGDYVYFKSIVPLHKISVSESAHRTTALPFLPCLSPQRLSLSLLSCARV
jgi:hypothetical protein